MSSSRGGRSCTRMETLTEVGQEQGGIEARGRERGQTEVGDVARSFGTGEKVGWQQL